MPEDIISPGDIKVVEPTIYADLNKDLLEVIKSLDSTALGTATALHGLYLEPGNKANINPGNHVIATVPYSREVGDERLRINEAQRNFRYDPDSVPIVAAMLDKERVVLNKVFSAETDEHEYRKTQKVHEETHQTQQIRLEGSAIKNRLFDYSKRMLADGKEDDPLFLESADINMKLIAFMELQAYRQSLVTQSIKRENRLDNAQLLLSNNTAMFAIGRTGEPIAEGVFTALQKGKMFDLEGGVIVNPADYALTMLLAGDPDLAEKMEDGRLGYERFKYEMLRDIKTLDEKPEEVMARISDPEFGRRIEAKLQETVSEAKSFLQANTSTDKK